MAHKLKDLTITEVSLVDKPANPGAKVVLFKRAEPEELPAAEADDAGNEGVKKGSGTMDIKEILKGLPDEQRKQVEAELAKVADLEKQVAEMKKGDQQKPEAEDVLKGASPELRKRFEDLEKRLAEAEAIAKAEREAREHAEMVKRAEAYSHIGKAEDVAKMLEQAYAVSKEYGEQLEATLKAAQERIEKGALFAEVGRDGQESSVLAKIEVKAAEIRKAEPGLTKEQAFTKALEADPELYTEYQQEAQ